MSNTTTKPAPKPASTPSPAAQAAPKPPSKPLEETLREAMEEALRPLLDRIAVLEKMDEVNANDFKAVGHSLDLIEARLDALQPGYHAARCPKCKRIVRSRSGKCGCGASQEPVHVG